MKGDEHLFEAVEIDARGYLNRLEDLTWHGPRSGDNADAYAGGKHTAEF